MMKTPGKEAKDKNGGLGLFSVTSRLTESVFYTVNTHRPIVVYINGLMQAIDHDYHMIGNTIQLHYTQLAGSFLGVSSVVDHPLTVVPEDPLQKMVRYSGETNE